MKFMCARVCVWCMSVLYMQYLCEHVLLVYNHVRSPNLCVNLMLYMQTCMHAYVRTYIHTYRSYIQIIRIDHTHVQIMHTYTSCIQIIHRYRSWIQIIHTDHTRMYVYWRIHEHFALWCVVHHCELCGAWIMCAGHTFSSWRYHYANMRAFAWALAYQAGKLGMLLVCMQ